MATLQPQSVGTAPITAISVTGDGRVFSGNGGGLIAEWDLTLLRPSVVFEAKAPITALVPYGEEVAWASADATIGIRGGPSATLDRPSASLGIDGNLLYATQPDSVHCVDARDLRAAYNLPVRDPRSVYAGGGIVAVGGGDGTLTVFDGDKPRWSVQASERGAVTAVAVIEQGVVAGGEDGLVRLWSGGEEFTAISGGAPVTAVEAGYFGGQRYIGSGRADGTLEVVLGDKERIVTIETGPDPIAALRLTVKDDRLIAVTDGPQGLLRTWDLDAVEEAAGSRSDKVEWQTDTPAPVDLLRRKPLARALAARLERIRQAEPGKSFLIHIDGAWGTGKSTIMSYLEDELEDGWLVVDFNAWRRSRVGPPWWALLVALRSAVAGRLGRLGRLKLRAVEAAARARRTGGPYLLALLFIAALAAALVLAVKPDGLNDLGDALQTVVAVLGALGTLWAGGLVAARLLLWDSAKGARVYEQSESDPMERVVEHFAWLARRAGRPILFFIDDLDRCPGDYVVDLLEAVQTLVRDAAPDQHGTYFVIAADGSWVRASYELRYQDFGGSVGEPGRPLGYLFLDKLFQLTVRVPSVSELDQSRYLAGLLAVSQQQPDIRAEVSAAQDRMQAGHSDEEVVAVLQQASPEAREVLREEAIERLTDAGVQAATEHALEQFAVMLEPNPRAMKRFVNAFGLARVVLTLEDALVPFDVLARWTILSTRWPLLADRLREHPEEIELAGTDAPGVPEALRALLASREVAEVAGELTAAQIHECVTGRSQTAAPAR